MRHFAAPKPQSDFDFIALFQESHKVAKLDFVVALVSTGPEFHFLDHNLLLLQLGFVLPLAFTIFELTKVHNTANRRLRRWCNFHQIQFGLFGHLVRRCDADDPNLLAFSADQTNLWCRNFSVNARFLFLCYAITP